jgi:hypothetical protein
MSERVMYPRDALSRSGYCCLRRTSVDQKLPIGMFSSRFARWDEIRSRRNRG